LSWVEAASIPEVFITGERDEMLLGALNSDICQLAFQTLVVVGQVKKDDNVLVHAGASGVGLAAIQIARTYGV
jgi:NADPH:quinone reductase-like Zn-dependent oxidoreductase